MLFRSSYSGLPVISSMYSEGNPSEAPEVIYCMREYKHAYCSSQSCSSVDVQSHLLVITCTHVHEEELHLRMHTIPFVKGSALCAFII